MIHIVESDGSLVVCLKPRGVLSEGEAGNTLPAMLAEQLGCPVYPVHRLDRETEGLMVFALTPVAAAALSRSILAGELKKEYLAVACGAPEAAGEMTDLLFYDRKRGKSFVVKGERKGVKRAALSYTRLAQYQGHALVRVALQTGRTHQIRVQFASRGLPLAGDRRYGAPPEGYPMALYSHRLSFPHPMTGKERCFVSYPAPAEGSAWAPFGAFLEGTDGQA